MPAMRKTKAKKEQPSAVDHVMKVTREQALEFGKMDAEVRNALQGIRLTELELQNHERTYVEKRSQLQLQHVKLKQEAETLSKTYEAFVVGLAKQYDIPDPKQMSIDPDTGIIRDLRSVKE